MNPDTYALGTDVGFDSDVDSGIDALVATADAASGVADTVADSISVGLPGMEVDALIIATTWVLTQALAYAQTKVGLPKGTRKLLPFTAIGLAVALRTLHDSGELSIASATHGIACGFGAVWTHNVSKPVRTLLSKAPPESQPAES